MSSANMTESSNGQNPNAKFIPKHLYDVNKLFPEGVGKCSITNGPDPHLCKPTKDWLSKVTFKACIKSITLIFNFYFVLLIYKYPK